MSENDTIEDVGLLHLQFVTEDATMVRPSTIKPVIAIALALGTAACAARSPAQGSGPGWNDLRGRQADSILGAFGPPDAVEQRDGERTYVYRRYRIVERPAMAPTITPSGQIIAPSGGREIELCETRIQVGATGQIGAVTQTGSGCAELGPQPPR